MPDKRTIKRTVSWPVTPALIVFLVLASSAVFLEAAAVGKSGDNAKPAMVAVRKPKSNVIHYVTLKKRRYLYLHEVAAYYNLNYAISGNAKAHKVILSNLRYGIKLEFTENSPVVLINGTTAALCYPILPYKGAFMLENTDFSEFIDPIMRPARIPRRIIRTIMLDAGHGGTDHGAEAGGVMEKTLNLAMAKRVGAILTKRGYRVLYTRDKDVTMSLAARSAAAKAQNPALFLSIHCNSTQQKSIHGIEVFIANPAGVPSYGTTTLGQDAPSTKYNRTNALWAYYTQKDLTKATKALERGVKRKQFYVIRETPTPSMLVEIGFLSNDAERKKLLQAEYQDKIAVALCDAIDKLTKAVRPPVKPASTAPPARVPKAGVPRK